MIKLGVPSAGKPQERSRWGQHDRMIAAERQAHPASEALGSRCWLHCLWAPLGGRPTGSPKWLDLPSGGPRDGDDGSWDVPALGMPWYEAVLVRYDG